MISTLDAIAPPLFVPADRRGRSTKAPAAAARPLAGVVRPGPDAAAEAARVASAPVVAPRARAGAREGQSR